MTKLSPDHPFRRHAANLAEVKKGLVQIERLHRAEIRRGSAPAVATLARFHTVAVGLMAEARLRAILPDPDGFNDRERDLLRRVSTQFGRWQAAVEYAFRRHYDVPIHRDLDQFIIGTIPLAQFHAVMTLLEEHLRAAIEDRNKTAHAQWKWHLNSNETAFTGRAPTPLNYRAIKVRSDLIQHVGDLVHVLVVSQPTFQREFNGITAAISALVPLADGHDYAAYAGKVLRAKAI